MSSQISQGSAVQQSVPLGEQQAKINEIRKQFGPAATKSPVLFSDASVVRFLKARNWNTKKATKLIKETLKWRLQYKPENIRWEDIAHEAETGKIYRANYLDKQGRPVLIMRPGFQNTNGAEGQVKYLIYCMENSILTLKPGQEQMVWLIDFQKWNMSSISVKVTKETARVLQNRYPERLGLAILYNPPKVFESFWMLVKPFLEHKTYKKVRFVYSDDPHSQKVMEDLFDMDKLETAFGGKGTVEFNYESYAKRMKEDDKRMSEFITSGDILPSDQKCGTSEAESSDSILSEVCSEESDEGDSSSNDDTASDLEGMDNKIEDSVIDTNKLKS